MGFRHLAISVLLFALFWLSAAGVVFAGPGAHLSGSPTLPQLVGGPQFRVQEIPDGLLIEVAPGPLHNRQGVLDCAGSIPYRVAGYPALPSLVREFLIPDDRQIAEVQVVGDDFDTIDYAPPIFQPRAKTPEGLKPVAYAPVRLSGVFPAEPVVVTEIEPLRFYRYRLCQMVMYPAQFDPNTQRTRIHSRLQVRVMLAPAPAPVREQSRFTVWAGERYGNLPVQRCVRGTRRLGAKVGDSLISPDNLAAATSVLAVDWEGGSPRFRYRAAFWDDGTVKMAAKDDRAPARRLATPAAAEAQLAKLGCAQPCTIATKGELADRVLAEWEHSPGVVLASPNLSHYLAPVASFMNWPLLVVENTAEVEAALAIGQRLGATTIVAAGCEAPGATVRVGSEQEANALLFTLHNKTGYLLGKGTPEDRVVRSRVLNPPAAPAAAKLSYVDYLLIYSPSDISETALDLLRNYRSALSWDVTNVTPALHIRDTALAEYAPICIALVGDGDYRETDQFFAYDSTGEGYDPAYIPTDFFYEERTSVACTDSSLNGTLDTVTWPSASGTRSWTPDSAVGRIMCEDDATFYAYLYMLGDYENGFTSYDRLTWAAFFSYFDAPYAATWDVHDRLVAARSLTRHPIYHYPGDPEPMDGIFTAANTYSEFAAQNSLFYFNTHGSHDSIVIGYGASDEMLSTQVDAVDWSYYPALLWIDSCLAGSLGNQVNSGYTLYFLNHTGGMSDTDDDTCFSTQWLSNGALGVISCSMISYLGDIDAYDRSLADEMAQYPYQSIAESVGYARARYYSATGGGDDYTKKTVLEVQFFGDPQVMLKRYPPPANPSGLTATAYGQTLVHLTWTDNASDEAGYEVWRMPDGGWWEHVADLPANSVEYSDGTGLAANTGYTYCVRAWSAEGYAQSNLASVYILGTPTNLTATATSSSTVRLTWADNAIGETGYEVWRQPQGGAWSLVTHAAANATSYHDSGLNRNSVYYYRVNAEDSGGWSDFSNIPMVHTPSFDDVLPSASIWPYVEAIVREGITSGCQSTPPLYCPTRQVTRGQMAVFLCRAAGLSPLYPSVATFADVPVGHPQFGYIERVYQAGITSGCTTTPVRNYCPDAPVTRGQMAVFLCRAAGIAAINPATATFADVPTTHPQYRYIEALVAAGVTSGCSTSPPLYCPTSSVTRGQMAVFLCRAFEIAL